MNEPRKRPKPPIHQFEQCCWDLRAAFATFAPDEACCDGLTPRQCRVLRAVGADPALQVSDLAEREGLTPGGMTRRIDPLVDGGYLERHKGRGEDGRAVHLELTPRGAEALGSVEDRIYDSIARVWYALPAAERPKVLSALRSLIRAAHEAEAAKQP